jgi:putative ATPase
MELLASVLGESSLLYDRDGEEHYNLLSAFIKSMRGSDPDAAIYWAMRMLEAGEDPLMVLRRMIIFASEDVGNADPRALQVAMAADEAFRRLGMPEGIYPIAQAALYLAVAPKSNAVKVAWQQAKKEIRRSGTLPVPLHLRNATTKLAKSLGYGQGYRYPHDEADNYAAGQTYLPESLLGRVFYRPSSQGLEKQIGEKLTRLRRAEREAPRGSRES